MPSYDYSKKISLKILLIVSTHLFSFFWAFSIFNSRGLLHVAVVASAPCLLVFDKKQSKIPIQNFHIPSLKYEFYDAAC